MYHFFCKQKLLRMPFGRDHQVQGCLHCKRSRGHLHWGSGKPCHTHGSSVCAAEVCAILANNYVKTNINLYFSASIHFSNNTIHISLSKPRYPDKVPELNTNTAILILHLSLTDFLYCLLGLPFIISTLQYGYFP